LLISRVSKEPGRLNSRVRKPKVLREYKIIRCRMFS
jgi:hypothetical protein